MQQADKIDFPKNYKKREPQHIQMAKNMGAQYPLDLVRILGSNRLLF